MRPACQRFGSSSGVPEVLRATVDRKRQQAARSPNAGALYFGLLALCASGSSERLDGREAGGGASKAYLFRFLAAAFSRVSFTRNSTILLINVSGTGLSSGNWTVMSARLAQGCDEPQQYWEKVSSPKTNGRRRSLFTGTIYADGRPRAISAKDDSATG